MITLQFLADIGVAVQIGKDTVDIEQIIQAGLAWRENPNFRPHIPVVWDLVAADVALDWAHLKLDLPPYIEKIAGSRETSSRTAWVVQEDIVEVVIESIHMAMPWTTQWQVFKDPAEAISWVTQSDA